jgi:hypothetical protein
MINLLPTDVIEDISYARKNRVTVRWVIALIFVIIGVGAMTVFGQYYINRNTKSLESVAKVTEQRISKNNLSSTQKEIQTLSNNFTTISQLLNKQLLFSKLFTKIGNIIPSGAILSGINLTTANSALDLNIAALTRESATQAFVNISDPKNGLFEKADLISVNCATPTATSTSQTESKYPCTAMIKVVMKTGSDYYFLNSIKSNGAN